MTGFLAVTAWIIVMPVWRSLYAQYKWSIVSQEQLIPICTKQKTVNTPSWLQYDKRTCGVHNCCNRTKEKWRGTLGLAWSRDHRMFWKMWCHHLYDVLRVGVSSIMGVNLTWPSNNNCYVAQNFVPSVNTSRGHVWTSVPQLDIIVPQLSGPLLGAQHLLHQHHSALIPTLRIST